MKIPAFIQDFVTQISELTLLVAGNCLEYSMLSVTNAISRPLKVNKLLYITNFLPTFFLQKKIKVDSIVKKLGKKPFSLNFND
jgi:hypothetical protein